MVYGDGVAETFHANTNMMYDADDDIIVEDSSVETESLRSHDYKPHHKFLKEDPKSNPNEESIPSHQKLTSLQYPQKKKRHGARNQHKMKYFVQWIHETFLNDTYTSIATTAASTTTSSSNRLVDSAHYILDVAGGKGELAARLVMCCKNIHVTMVDPRLADIATV